ncbi:MAG: ABC transporter substrate-binding protein [Hyphomicrobiales bacterium]
MIRKIVSTLLMILWSLSIARADVTMTVGYLELIVPQPPVLSNLQATPDDQGLAGAQVGLSDNQTTGKFLKHRYSLETTIVNEGGDIASAAKQLLAKTPYLIINAPREALIAVADLPEAKNALLLNVSAPDNALRNGSCRVNVLHTLPSRSMLSDALAQFALKKRWTKWAMLYGVLPGDLAFKVALEKSAKKFGIKFVAQKEWLFTSDMRRNASQEVPLFTQDLPDHDMLIIADEPGDFGRYVLYNTWLPRPTAGSEGIVPTAWSPSVEQHGAAQLQKRFQKQKARPMQAIDFAAWAAMRVIGEAVTRTNTNELQKIRDYILSDKFQLAGFKGRPLTFRKWNGQLRQPIPLSHSRAVIANAPLEGFLHKNNELDTLGLDIRESSCTSFTE